MTFKKQGMYKGFLVSWVVYDHPKDFPSLYVARRFEDLTPTGEIYTNTSLEVIRCDLASLGFTRLMRSEKDDPCIIECWL